MAGATASIEKIESEFEDDYSNDDLFNITSWGADLSFRELVTMYKEGELIKPEIQRNYVWDKKEASRFIDSLLMGLPVPSIFLARSTDEKKLIVDGYQRIMTVYDFLRGVFSKDGSSFKLTNSEQINIRWRNKTFSELPDELQRKIRATTIHAIIFEQRHPENDDTSLYQVFERINTSGRGLTPQEIRNCVYQGPLNSFLIDFNLNKTWRKLFGTEVPDPRMRDMEFILRFLLLREGGMRDHDKRYSLKKCLNEFMKNPANNSDAALREFGDAFSKVIEFLNEHLGHNAFHNVSEKGGYIDKFHPTIFDSLSVATYLYLQGHGKTSISSGHLEERKRELLKDEVYKYAIRAETMRGLRIDERIVFAGKYLYEADL